ncbi:hypothetical protein Tco_0515849, partial [Tanacetum coccineum]
SSCDSSLASLSLDSSASFKLLLVFCLLELSYSSYSSASLFELPAANSGTALSTSLSIGTNVFTLLIVVSNKVLISSKE